MRTAIFLSGLMVSEAITMASEIEVSPPEAYFNLVVSALVLFVFMYVYELLKKATHVDTV